MINKLEYLESKIINKEDKILFREVIGTYKDGYNRASYIISWINLIEALKNKLYELSHLNDSRALKAIKAIEHAENKKQSTDKIIFEQSKECTLINDIEYCTISFLWDQRCIFAHPYNSSPTKQELEFIINQSVELVLSKRISFNKLYINEFCTNLIEKPYMIESATNKINELSNNTLMRIKEDLHPYFFKQLFFNLRKNIENIDRENEINKIRIIIQNTLLNTTLSLEDSNWKFEETALKYPFEFSIAVVNREIWKKLNPRTKDILINFHDSNDSIKQTNQLNNIYKELVHNKILEEEYILKYFNKLNNLDFNSSIYYYGDFEQQYLRIAKEMQTWNFLKQDIVLQFINSDYGHRIINHIHKKSQFELGRILLSAREGNHFKSKYLIDSIYNGSSKMPKELQNGVFYACFIKLDNSFYINYNDHHTIIEMLNDLDCDKKETIFNYLFNFLDNNNSENSIYRRSYKNMGREFLTEFLKQPDIVWKGNSEKLYNIMLEKIENYFK